MGGNPQTENSENVRTRRLLFPAGVRFNLHGAHPDEAALQLTIYEGKVNWLEPITDAEYHVTSGAL